MLSSGRARRLFQKITPPSVQRCCKGLSPNSFRSMAVAADLRRPAIPCKTVYLEKWQSSPLPVSMRRAFSNDWLPYRKKLYNSRLSIYYIGDSIWTSIVTNFTGTIEEWREACHCVECSLLAVHSVTRSSSTNRHGNLLRHRYWVRSSIVGFLLMYISLSRTHSSKLRLADFWWKPWTVLARRSS